MKKVDEVDEINAIIDSHFLQYINKGYSIVVKLSLFKKEEKTFLFYGRILPKLKDENLEIERLVYDNFAYYQIIIPPNEVQLRTPYLLRNKSLSGSTYYYEIDDVTFVSNSISPISKEKEIERMLEYYNIPSVCRTVLTKRYPGPSMNCSEKLETHNLNLPNFPTIKELIFNKFHFNCERFSVSNTIHIALAPLEGYLSNIVEETGVLKVGISKNSKELFTLKFYGENPKGDQFYENFEIKDSTTITINKNLVYVDLKLFNSQGLVIDSHSYHFDEKTPLKEFKRLLKEGEGLKTEFKEWKVGLSPHERKQRSEKFARLISAFANAEGGVILFGVDDSANIVGIPEKVPDEIDKCLQNINDSKLSPKVTIVKDNIKIGNKIVGIFTILKSEKIIQCLDDEHYYIRRGGTNRIIDSDEIEAFQKGSRF